MEGLFIHPASGKNPRKDLTLVEKHGDLEIMTQRVKADAAAWLYPAEDENTFEFFYVLSGALEITGTDGEHFELNPGDSFSLQRLKQDVLMKCKEDAVLLYVSNSPVFDNITFWKETLMEQIRRIDEKDKYTLQHSHAVMHYSVALYEELREFCSNISLERFVLGTLFHDVGKCNIPDNILCKPARLTPEEYEIMKRHSIESGKILEPLFGKAIATLASLHHERLDGSGYPRGLKGDDISFEARILMVADAFDAMTGIRAYRKAKQLEEAARELCGLSNEYDAKVTNTLLKMIREGRLTRYTPDFDEKQMMAATSVQYHNDIY